MKFWKKKSKIEKIKINPILDGIEQILDGIYDADLSELTNKEITDMTARTSYTKGILDSYIDFYGANPNYSEAVTKLKSIIKRCYREAERRDKGF